MYRDLCLPASTCASVLFLSDEVMMRAGCCWQGLSLLLTVLLVLLSAWRRKGASQESTATGCHTVSRPVCLFTCVHLHFFTLRDYFFMYFFLNWVCKHTIRCYFLRESQRVKSALSLASTMKLVTRRSHILMHVKQSLLHTIFTSHTPCTVYLINITQAATFLDRSGDGTSGCTPAQLYTVYRYFFPAETVSADLSVLRVPPVPSAQQHEVDWRARGQHLDVDEQKINLRKVH